MDDYWLKFTDESGSDSDGAESTSSSYSSLSDFVTDMVNSEIDGDTPSIFFFFVILCHYMFGCCENVPDVRLLWKEGLLAYMGHMTTQNYLF